jgi:hypothetical protein
MKVLRRRSALGLVVGLLLAALFGALIGSLVGFAVDLYVSTQSVVLTTDSTWTTEGAPLGAVMASGRLPPCGCVLGEHGIEDGAIVVG